MHFVLESRDRTGRTLSSRLYASLGPLPSKKVIDVKKNTTATAHDFSHQNNLQGHRVSERTVPGVSTIWSSHTR